MEDIEEQVAKLVDSWKRIYKTASAAPSAWQPHLPYTSLVILEEVLETVSYWLSRVRAPAGFSPGFHLAKSMAAVSLPSLLASAKQLEASQYNHFPTFVSGLMNLLSALHTMAVFSPKSEADATAADITAQLSQGLALLGTAQKELAEKAEQLKEKANLAEAISEKHNEVVALAEAAKKSSDAIAEHNEESSSALGEIKKLLDGAKEHDEEFSSLLTENKTLQGKIASMTDELTKLQEKSMRQQQTIESILPKGASAGLAAAFALRGSQLNLAKWIWMGVFVAAIAGLSYFAYHLTTTQVPTAEDFWKHVLYRIPLAAPLVWLGWFSAIQYGNIVRVQEDYAFKEATSKAFQGYRDHMEHLASVDLPEATTAMNLMAARTIEILAHEPLRIYGKTEKDASPAHGFAELFSNLKPKSKGDDK